jgi:hypothetical protein
MVTSEQPWLDGYCVEKGIIRQFIAMPLGADYSAEEQITGKGEYGGIQIAVYPMKKKAFEKYFPKREYEKVICSGPSMLYGAAPSLGLAPGGRMRQEIYDDRFDLDD